jgi:hypothetical protein
VTSPVRAVVPDTATQRPGRLILSDVDLWMAITVALEGWDDDFPFVIPVLRAVFAQRPWLAHALSFGLADDPSNGLARMWSASAPTAWCVFLWLKTTPST